MRATLARFGDELGAAYRLTLQRFLTLQVQGSDEGSRDARRTAERAVRARRAAPATLAGALSILAGDRPARRRARRLGADARRQRPARRADAAGRGAWLARAMPRHATSRSPAPRTHRSCRIARRSTRPLRRFSMPAEPNFAAPDPRDVDPLAVRRAFGRAAATYDSAAVLQREVGARMAARLDYVKVAPARVLDAGCGTGEAVGELSVRYPDARVVGARRRAADGGGGARARAARPLAAAQAVAGAADRRPRSLVRVRRRQRAAAARGRVRRRLEQPAAAVGERPAARVRRTAARAEGRRAADVHDVRSRYAAGGAPRVRTRRRPHAHESLRRHARHRRHAGRTPVSPIR